MILTVFHVEWVDLSWACAALCSVAVLCVSKLFLRAFALKQWNRLEHLPPQVDKSIEVKYHHTPSPSATQDKCLLVLARCFLLAGSFAPAFGATSSVFGMATPRATAEKMGPSSKSHSRELATNDVRLRPLSALLCCSMIYRVTHLDGYNLPLT